MTDTPPLLVRPAREEDLDRLAALEAEAFPDPWTRELLAEELLQPQAIVLTAGRPGGPAEGYVSLRHGGGEAEILRLAVDSAARRRGVARA
ncbi:MAG TPA: ribosomal-protein-alanine N-acetyltransferase, partial [Acidobacteria bacterium]|nr:ribosomal-protein-alanine N-acetyltransferase [Acidobacteriota bacterium]